MSLHEISNHSEYPGVHMQETSMYLEAMPVDTRNPAISQLITKDIPAATSLITLNQADGEETYTIGNGVPIFWASLQERLRRLASNPENPLYRTLDSELFVVDAITNSVAPHTAHVRMSTERTDLTGFEITLFGDNKHVTAIHGDFSVEPMYLPSETGQLHIPEFASVNYQDKPSSGTREPQRLDDTSVLSIVNTLVRATGRKPRDPVGTLRERLQQIIAGSDYQIRRDGEYSVENLALEFPIRTEVSHRTSQGRTSQTAGYTVLIEEKSPLILIGDNVVSHRQLTLEYDRSKAGTGGLYKAGLAISVTDPDKDMPIEQRAQHFTGLSSFYRRNPEQFFETIQSVLQRLVDTPEAA